MSMVTYPLNNIEYTAEDAELFHSTRTSGVYATNSFDFSVTGADNTVVIGNGIAWIKNTEFSGKVVAQKESVSLDLGVPDSYYPRIDAIVIQFDANKNATDIVVKKGTASSNPIAPSVVRTESVYELHLYHIRRDAGSLAISSNVITDLRSNENYCGLMSDSVTQAVDTTLSKRGVAADAASVGAALSVKAQAGYGYGEVPVSLGSTTDDAVFLAKLNEQFDLTNSKTRQVTFTMGGVTYIGTLWNAGNGYGTLTANSYTDAKTGTLLTKIVRNCANGNWQPWEYENPPLKNNTEYRTTERYGAKAVYIKRINYGALAAANTTVTIPLNVTAVTELVDFEIITTLASGNKTTFPLLSLYDASPHLSGHFRPASRAFVLQTHADLSGATAVLTVKYTKD